jgi:16S rRNA (guanine527-N7)-methyltransferase
MEQLNLPLDVSQEQHLLQFLTLLVKWNRTYNLTAVRDPLEMVGRHLLDSLAVLPHLQGSRCLDMGTGPGLPGLPLAIMRPEMSFVLLDSNGKKIRFVRQALLELGLGNARAVQRRIESYQSDDRFDLLIARAFTALPRMLELTAHLRHPETVLLAMKAEQVEKELSVLGEGYRSQLISLEVPFVQGTRCLIAIKSQITN